MSAVSAPGAESTGHDLAPGQLVVRLDGTRIYSRDLVGGKGHGLSKIRAAGLPTPPAFTATVEACRQYFDDPDDLMARLWPQLREHVAWLEDQTGHVFGGGPVPLLVSVRSGAQASMPGMMDTVLNLGINDVVEGILAESAGAAFAADTRRRFTEPFRHVVVPVDGIVPDDPGAQLRAAVCAVFESWNSARAVAYRHHHDLDGTVTGTAVTVQAMAFGNLDDQSGTGVLLTRNPLTGEHRPFGEWLPRAQGEDVVSGRFDPLPLDALAQAHPDVHRQLLEAASWLESDAADVQDVEFTVESGKLYLLQTRAAKRSARAAVTIAVALQRDGVIDVDEALARITPAQIDVLLTPTIDPEALKDAVEVASGLPACPGVGAGLVVGDSDAAEDAADEGRTVVLARATTSPSDVGGMISSAAVITEQGGATSHAAVVSRELHTPCVVGCGAGSLGDLIGTEVTVDGDRGKVYAGALAVIQPSEATDPELAMLLEWARHRSPVDVVGTETAGASRVDHRQPDTIADALFGGAQVLVAEHPLPTLLTVLALTRAYLPLTEEQCD